MARTVYLTKLVIYDEGLTDVTHLYTSLRKAKSSALDQAKQIRRDRDKLEIKKVEGDIAYGTLVWYDVYRWDEDADKLGDVAGYVAVERRMVE